MICFQEERNSGEQALSVIAKTHEKIRNESKGIYASCV